MVAKALLDTGPLVAVFAPKESAHESCVELLRTLRPPFFTTWAVLTEAAWLLRLRPEVFKRLLQAGLEGLFELPPFGADAFPWLMRFMERYRDRRVQLADASLVYLAEREKIDTVITLDRRDFSVYRFGRSRCFNILP